MLAVSACPLPVASLIWQSQPSTWVLTVVCRATFVLLPGESALADDQEECCEHDDHWDDDPARSLRAGSDLVPMKARADVTLVGHAFAPGGARVRSLIARLLVGELSKTIEVVADRYVDAEGVLQDGPPFARMPLVYERAAGGPGTTNPVGVAGQANRFGRIPLPNLQQPGIVITSLDEYVAPVGFGPVAPGWPSRREKLGRGAAMGAPPDLQRPLPDDFDPSYFNHAPRDQQVQILRDRERIILENLHPEHPRLCTDLPSVRPRAVVERRGRSRPVPLRCDTLWIDTDRALCTLTWRAQVPLERPDDEGRVVISLEATGLGATPHGSELGRLQLRAPDSISDTMDHTMDRLPTPPELERVLPFTSAPGGVPRPPASGPGLHERAPRPPGTGLPFVASRSTTGAPFVAAPPAAAQPPPAVAIPPPRPSQPPAVPPPAPPAVEAGPPPARASLWSLSEAPAAAVAPLTVGQLAAQPPPLPAKPVIPAARPSMPSAPPVAATPVAPEVPVAPPVAAAKPEGKRALQLVWYEPECLPRLRRKPAYQAILAALEDRPLDADLDDPAIARDPAQIEDRRDAFEVLARGDALDEPGLEEALDRAVRDDGKFVSPFLLVAGELRFVFDDLAALRATVALATPFVSGDEGLKVALADARELLATPDLLSPAGLAERFTTRIQEAFRKARRQVAPTYLEDQVERALLEKRLYQRREVFGAPHLRALLAMSNARPWPLYLPEGVASKLPMFARFNARLVVDAHLQEDQFEAHPNALRARAMVRVVALTRAPSPTVIGAR